MLSIHTHSSSVGISSRRRESDSRSAVTPVGDRLAASDRTVVPDRYINGRNVLARKIGVNPDDPDARFPFDTFFECL